MSGTSVSQLQEIPFLKNGFSLISIEERAEWREALARQIIAAQEDEGQLPSMQWKNDEQLRPMMLTVAVMLENGFDSPQAIKKYFGVDEIGCDYAASK